MLDVGVTGKREGRAIPVRFPRREGVCRSGSRVRPQDYTELSSQIQVIAPPGNHWVLSQ